MRNRSVERMDLEGDLPELREQFGGRGDSSSYVCDHVSIRRLNSATTVRLGIWRKFIKFVKVGILRMRKGYYHLFFLSSVVCCGISGAVAPCSSCTSPACTHRHTYTQTQTFGSTTVEKKWLKLYKDNRGSNPQTSSESEEESC